MSRTKNPEYYAIEDANNKSRFNHSNLYSIRVNNQLKKQKSFKSFDIAFALTVVL